MKKRLAILVAALAVVAFAGTAFAGAVDVTVGAPYIQKGLCDQAGNITLEFDVGTKFEIGDQIKIGLVGQPTFCKTIDMLVAAGDAGSHLASGFTNKVALSTANTAPLRTTMGTSGAITSTGEGVAFHVKAAEGSDTLTITVVCDSNGDGTFGGSTDATTGHDFTFVDGTNADNELQLVLFNSVTYGATPAATTSGIFKTGSNPDVAIVKTDNTLCVNTGANFGSNYVGVGISAMDKDANKLWDFNPASPNIAIVKAGQSYTLYDCAKSEPGTILLCSTTSAEQEASESALPIINENGTGAPGGVAANVGPKSDLKGYSTDTGDAYKNLTHRNNNLVFQTSTGTPFENGDYKLELEIKVAPEGSSEALSGDYGVYWNSTTIKMDGMKSAGSVDYADKLTSACAASDAEGAAIVPAVTAYDASGAKITTWKADKTGDCKYDAAATKALVLKTAVGSLADFKVDYNTDGYMYINLPNMVYDASKLTAGKNVYVEAKLIKMPCELVGTGKLLVGTAATVSNTGTAKTITYPYFAEVPANGKASQFYNGFTIANTSTTATAEGTATLTIYEADGDSFTSIVKVKPGAVTAFLLSNLPNGVTETTASKANTTGDHVFGGQRCWVKVSADFTPYGSAMITNKDAGGVMSYVVGNNTNDQ